MSHALGLQNKFALLQQSPLPKKAAGSRASRQGPACCSLSLAATNRVSDTS